MSFIMIAVILLVAVAVCFIIAKYVSPPIFRNVLIGVVCVALVLWVLNLLGFLHYVSGHL